MTDETGTTYRAGASYIVTKDVTLYAKWHCAVIFESGGGSAVESQAVNPGDAARRPTDPARSGYVFGGWYGDSSLTEEYDFSAPLASSITLYAKWDAIPPDSYTVIFDSNGGGSVATQVVNSGEQAIRPEDPARDGYALENWYRDSGMTMAYDFSAPIAANITLYAKWEASGPDTFTVTFNSGGGSGIAAQTVNSGDAARRPANPTRNGYAFGGWHSDAGFAMLYDFSVPVTENITLYAKWELAYTVSFYADGGTPAPAQQFVAHGGTIAPPAMIKRGYVFFGWYKEEAFINEWNFASDFVTGNTSLYARWGTVPGAGLAEKLAWLQSNAQSNAEYIVEVEADESIEPYTLSYGGRSNIGITLIGTGAERTVVLSSVGSMFAVSADISLVLDRGITLQGRGDNNASLVYVESGGKLFMNEGAKIIGNTANEAQGGGVLIDGGTFAMEGGEISGNAADLGGGVYLIGEGATFAMSGEARISDNTASRNGGGVLVNGAFTMDGGEISGNTASSSGGGVRVNTSATFAKTGGTIYGSVTANGNAVKNDSGAVQNDQGHAVYAGSGSTIKRKETTAGPAVNLSYNGTVNPVAFSGEWDY